MTLPKKSRSSIVVDAVTFHWTRGRSPENMWVTVQHGSGHGALLRIDTHGIPLPDDIADAIRFAMQSGWQPESGGDMFFLGFTDLPDYPRFVVRAHDSPDYWREFSRDTTT
jgi:hypothetical protein